MKHLLFLMLFFLSMAYSSAAKEIPYPVSSIDTALSKNAGMVVRLQETTLQIKSLNSEVLKIHYILTILKSSAEDNAIFKAYYDDYSTINVFKGSMYDANGVLVRNFNEKDISDLSSIGEGILYSDDRVKVIRPVLNFYPVTLEYFLEITIKRILFYPAFFPQDDYEQAVEKASLAIETNEDLFPRFLETRIPENTIVTGDEKTKKRWEFKDLKPLHREPLSPSLKELVPVIYLNPTIYNIKGYTGDFSTWSSFGKWMATLMKGRDSLPQDIVQKVRVLAQGIPDREGKAKKIYKYLQQSTRYVGVEIGLGGLQPEDASKVARLGYGDCKGLVNYCSALLKCAGVPSFPTLIHAGENQEPMIRNFPGNQFNHVILCVPLEKDSAWLECTSQKMPFGFIGNFTDDRDALLICPDGGVLVHTPAYNKNVNKLIRKITVSVDSTGNAIVSVNARYSGLLYESVAGLKYLSPEKQKDQLTEKYPLPGVKIISFAFDAEEASIPTFTESVEMKIQSYASLNADRIFIPLTRLLDHVDKYIKDDHRTTNLILRNSYSITDSLYFILPKRFVIESKPTSCELKTVYGTFLSAVINVDSKVLFTRFFEREEGTFSPSSYNDFVEFNKKIVKQDNKNLVLVKEK